MYERPVIAEDHKILRDDDHLPGWITDTEGVLLRYHAEHTTINRVLEIGTLIGRSSSFILEGLRRKYGDKPFHLWCVDPWEKREWLSQTVGHPPALFWDYMAEHDYCYNVHMLQCKSDLAASIVRTMRYDFAFIDGDHSEPWIWHDLMLCSQVTNKILVHDYLDDDDEEYIDVFRSTNKFVETQGWTMKKRVDRTAVLVRA